MNTLIHWQQEAREFKQNHAPQEPERFHKVRKPVYSRMTGRCSTLIGFRRRKTKRSF